MFKRLFERFVETREREAVQRITYYTKMMTPSEKKDDKKIFSFCAVPYQKVDTYTRFYRDGYGGVSYE